MRFLKLFLVVCFIVLPVSVFAEKAKTIEELAAMYDSSRCKECHAEIYARWENSHHARSLMRNAMQRFMPAGKIHIMPAH
jgi:hypothetical protein